MMAARAVRVLSLTFLAAVPALAADPAAIDWSGVPASRVSLFYPGQSSYEWLRKDHRGTKGAKAAEGMQACIRCHEGDEKALGEKIVKGGALEPAPVKGKNGFIELKVQAAYDAKNAYLRFQWRTAADRAGSNYPSYRFDGKEWKVYGAPKLDKAVQEGKQPGVYEDRLSLMLDDGKVPGFSRQGCWLTCHDGSRDMQKEASKADAQGAIRKDDVRKYLPASRGNPADWRTVKPAEELARIKAAGGFTDLIQWRAHRSNPVGGADDGYVLEFRNFDEGKNHFASNLDGQTKQPRFMFDAAKKGPFLIKGVNAVPFDANAGWKAGDMLPRYYLQPADATGSAADNKASGTWKDGEWTVLVIRPLGLANADDKSLKEGGVYSVGFAVHDDNITTRGHHVSFVRTLGIGAIADIQAVKLP
jgi:ethylbenzene dehydrogenase